MVEQNNRSLNKDIHYVDEMNSTNHMFLVPFLMELKNIMVNSRFEKLILESYSSGAQLGHDTLGRAVIQHGNQGSLPRLASVIPPHNSMTSTIITESVQKPTLAFEEIFPGKYSWDIELQEIDEQLQMASLHN